MKHRTLCEELTSWFAQQMLAEVGAWLLPYLSASRAGCSSPCFTLQHNWLMVSLVPAGYMVPLHCSP